jgi:hypothetical protein
MLAVVMPGPVPGIHVYCCVVPGWSEGPDPESRDSQVRNCAPEFDASHRPAMTEDVGLFSPPQRAGEHRFQDLAAVNSPRPACGEWSDRIAVVIRVWGTLRESIWQSVGWAKPTGRREAPPDDRLRVPTGDRIRANGGHGASAPLPTLRSYSSLRANGSRECAPDDRLREAIQNICAETVWIASSLTLLAMTDKGRIKP